MNSISYSPCKGVKILLAVLLVLFQSMEFRAQLPLVSFEKLSVQDGLSNSSVYSLFQDPDGFIWIGTADGLNRFDGYNFIQFEDQLPQQATVSGDMITSIDAGSDGTIWFSVQFGGLVAYSPSTGTFTSFLINPGEAGGSANNIWVIKADLQNRIWAGTTENGLYLFNPATSGFTPVLNDDIMPGVPCNSISAIIVDHNGDIRVSTSKGGIFIIDQYSLDKKPFKPEFKGAESLAVNEINTFYEDSRQRLWIGTRLDGCFILEKDGTLLEHLPGDKLASGPGPKNVRCFMEDLEGTVWIGTDGGGLLSYNPEESEYSVYLHNQDDPMSLSSNVIFALLRSRDGLIWTGTNKGGLNFYDQKRDRFNISANRDLPLPRNLNYKVLLSVFEDRDGNTWFGTDGGGLHRYRKRDHVLELYKNIPVNNSSISGNAIKVIYQDNEGKIWAGSYGNGLNLFRESRHDFLRVPSSGSTNAHDIWDITEDPDGNLWIATLNDGLFQLRKGSLELNAYDPGAGKDIIGEHLFCVLWDRESNGLWIGTNEGLKFLDHAGKVTSWKYNQDDTLSTSGNEIKALFLDRKNDLWIGTRKGGLNKFDREKGRFYHYTTEDGLLSNTIASIQEDDGGRLWVSTNAGLSIFDPGSEKWSSFTVDDGLRNNEFLSESSCRLADGAFLFGGVNGFDLVDPGQFVLNSYLPKVQITRILVNNKERWPGSGGEREKKLLIRKDQLVLPHGMQSLSIQVSALSFTHPEKNRYDYRVVGYHDNWTDLGSQRTITLNDLPPGTYDLQVRSANNDGLWNEQPTVIKLQLLPPWWSTLLFRIVLAVFIFSLLLLGFMWKIKYDRRQKQKLEALIERRTRELERAKKLTEEQNLTLIEIQKRILKQNEEISRQKENIEHMSELARQADQEKLVFFTNISHEIRTPLSLIIGPLEQMMNDYSLNRTVRNQLAITYRNSLSLLNLVNQILDFRRIESNNYPFRPVSADIVPLLHEVFISFSQKAANQNIRFSFSADPRSITGMFDTEKIDKIIFNLLSNAFKFTPKGGEIELRCHTEAAMPGSNLLIIEVRDSGKGIEEAYLEKIFTRFFRVPDKENQLREGTGIGLSLVKSLTDLQHGHIEVESTPGSGSMFRLSIPFTSDSEQVIRQSALSEVIASDPDSGKEKAGKSREKKGKAGNEKPKILICEDHLELLEFIAGQLESEFRVLKSTNGEEGLELIRKSIPDLVVSDVMMPGMNGVEFCQAIKENLETSHIPVILLTARSGIEYKLEGLDAGADDYLYKPFRVDELIARINNLISSRILLRKKFSNETMPDPGELTLTTADEIFLSKAIKIVEKEMGNPDFNAGEFVKELHMSRTLVHNKLKELTDTSASGFIRTLRLKKAALLLSSRKNTVSEVAYLVGFNDPKYFHKCFREQYGITPRDFIDQPAS